MSLRITKNGLLDTIQDGGRYGYQYLGINPGGVMDGLAMKVANALVGNEAKEAVIEMHFPAAEILFEETKLIALCGADFSASIRGELLPLFQPIMIQKGSLLSFTKKITGARVYLSVEGGLVCNEWLHSCSTNLRVNAGGFLGRAFKKNDQILFKQEPLFSFQNTSHSFEILPWKAKITAPKNDNRFRFLPGAEYNQLQRDSMRLIESGIFSINRENDRMGYRLAGEKLLMNSIQEMISSAVTLGTLQLLPDGQLIVLMADHQTTGGYPRIGHIISADISSLAQVQTGEILSFEKVTIDQAENLWLEQEMNLLQIKNACTFRLDEYLSD